MRPLGSWGFSSAPSTFGVNPDAAAAANPPAATRPRSALRERPEEPWVVPLRCCPPIFFALMVLPSSKCVYKYSRLAREKLPTRYVRGLEETRPEPNGEFQPVRAELPRMLSELGPEPRSRVSGLSGGYPGIQEDENPRKACFGGRRSLKPESRKELL